MNTKSLSIACALIVLGTVVAAAVLIEWHMSDAIVVTVYDNATGDPVKGVIVVATWQITRDHGVPIRDLYVAEEKTNQAGFAELPGWGPLMDFSRGSLSNRQPTIRFFKHGYIPAIRRGVGTRSDTKGNARFQITVQPVEIVVPIARHCGALSEYEDSMRELTSSLRTVYRRLSCSRTKMPMLVDEIEYTRLMLSRYNLGQSLPIASQFHNRTKCEI